MRKERERIEKRNLYIDMEGVWDIKKESIIILYWS